MLKQGGELPDLDDVHAGRAERCRIKIAGKEPGQKRDKQRQK
jgi:hypothetical protein